MRSWLLAIACCAGCWTGSAPPSPSEPTNEAQAPADKPLKFRIKLERTACLGRCPVYSVVIHGDGRVQWNGIENVATMGPLVGRAVAKRDLQQLANEVRKARFFERDSAGELPAGPICSTVNGMTTCSTSMHFCSDTTHSRLTVTLDGKTHMIDNDHCDAKPGIDEIELAVDQLAGTAEYIGQ